MESLNDVPGNFSPPSDEIFSLWTEANQAFDLLLQEQLSDTVVEAPEQKKTPTTLVEALETYKHGWRWLENETCLIEPEEAAASSKYVILRLLNDLKLVPRWVMC